MTPSCLADFLDFFAFLGACGFAAATLSSTLCLTSLDESGGHFAFFLSGLGDLLRRFLTSFMTSTLLSVTFLRAVSDCSASVDTFAVAVDNVVLLTIETD